MASNSERYQITNCVKPQLAPFNFMMNTQVLTRSAINILTRPVIPFKYLSLEFDIIYAGQLNSAKFRMWPDLFHQAPPVASD